MPAATANTPPKATPAPQLAGVYEYEVDAADGTGRIRFALNPRVYPLELVYQAAFIFIDKYYVYLDRDEDARVWCTLRGKESLSAGELTATMGAFANELLAQAVRRLVNRQNGKLREMVVAKALWGTGAVDIDKGLAFAEKQEDVALRARLDDEAKREQEELDRLLAEIEEEFAQDPLGIATPWEEKFGAGGATRDTSGK